MDKFKIGTLKTKHNREDRFIILLVLVWTRSILTSYVYQTLKLIPDILYFADFIKITVYSIAILLAIPFYMKKIKIKDVLFYLILCIAFYINIQMYPNTSNYLIENTVNILCIAIPAFFIGLVLDNDKHIDTLHFWSQVCMVAILLHFMIFGFQAESGGNSNMGLAYRILPHLCMILFYVIRNKKASDIVLSIVGGLLLLACGTRGAVLGAILFVVVYGLFVYRSKKKWIILPLIGVISIVIYLNFASFLLLITNALNTFNFSTRIIEGLASGTIYFDNGRSEISEMMFELIKAQPWTGYGIAGDRGFSSWILYSHNLWLEMWMSYGVVFGSLFLIIISITIIRAIMTSNEKQKGFLLAMIFGGALFKLFMSSSYLIEYQFFMLIGYCVCLKRKSGKKRKMKICGNERISPLD